MMRHALRATALTLAMIGAGALAADEMPRVWLFHEAWPPEPAQPAEPWKSKGVIVTFCPGGELRLLSGTLFRARNEVTIAREGIVVLPGTWSGTKDNLEARYVLASGENQSAGPSLRAVHKKATRPRLVNGDEVELDAVRLHLAGVDRLETVIQRAGEGKLQFGH